MMSLQFPATRLFAGMGLPTIALDYCTQLLHPTPTFCGDAIAVGRTKIRRLAYPILLSALTSWLLVMSTSGLTCIV